MPPWYQNEKLRIAAMALAAGLLLGGLVTVAAGFGRGKPETPGTSARSMAAALASDQAIAPPAPAKAPAKPKAKPKAKTAAPKKVKRKPAKKRSAPAAADTDTAATATPTSTPDADERARHEPPSPSPRLAASRRAPASSPSARRRSPRRSARRRPSRRRRPPPRSPPRSSRRRSPSPRRHRRPRRRGPGVPATATATAATTIPATAVSARGPGRVNLIGEHTDYNGGLALPFAIDRGVTATAEPLAGDRVEVVAEDLGETDAFPLAGPEPAEGWRAFARGVVAELTAAGVELVPARIAFTGDVPRGAGLSSSAALETALCLALLGVAGAEEPDRVELAKLCSRVENDWVGAETGLLDQLASLLGSRGPRAADRLPHARDRAVPLDLRGWQLVTVDSGAAHEHAASGYNERRAECEAAASELGRRTLSEATRARRSGCPSRGAGAPATC